MSNYPTALPTYRTINNRPDVEFDENNEYAIFAEDIEQVRDELSATQQTIGTRDPAPADTLFTKIEQLNSQITTLTNDLSAAQDNIANLTPPVGRIIITIDDVNPGTQLPGTWQLIAEGKTLVGVDITDSDFDTPNTTGGHKDLQSHDHGNGSLSATTSGSAHEHTRLRVGSNDINWTSNTRGGGPGSSVSALSGSTIVARSDNSAHTHGISGSTSNTGSGNSGNLMPYLTVFFWQRVS